MNEYTRNRPSNQRFWRTVVAVGGAAGVLACASTSRPSAPRVAAPAHFDVVDSVWYISARGREAGKDSRRLSDSLEYGIAIYTRSQTADPLRDALNVRLVDSVTLSPEDFVTRLHQRTHPDRGEPSNAVLYVHGFGTSLHEGWQYAEEAQLRTRGTTPWIVFCWPANGAGIDWPRTGQWLTRAYHDDMEVARQSVPAFVRSAATVLRAIPPSQLTIAAHSLGGALLGDAIVSPLGLRAILSGERLRALAFIAPDVSAEAFRVRVAPAAAAISARPVLYLSGRDRVLAMARVVRDSASLTVSDGPALVSAGMEVVDASDGYVAEGWFQSLLGTHHAIRRVSSTLFDLEAVVGGQRAAACRETLVTGTRTDDGVWRLTPTRPPSIAASKVCAPF